jgi:hypothetical protein
MLRKAVLEGPFYPFNYAILIDRYRGIKSLPQKYGCYWKWDKKGNKINTEIEDLENVDVRRKEIGLNLLGYSAQQHNLILPAGYNPR